jgi:two-component system cell cycle response regulator DivK
MSKRILVVEDQPDSRRIIRDMLASTDYEIIEAGNGEEALAAIAKQRPDLILMDIQLPIMDGYTATRRIKADSALRSIPIIAVTASRVVLVFRPSVLLSFRMASHIAYDRQSS